MGAGDNGFSYAIIVNIGGNYQQQGQNLNNTLQGINKQMANMHSNSGHGMGFFGKITQGFSTISHASAGVLTSLLNVKTALAGVVGALGVGAFASSLLHTANELEHVYAKLITVFGSQKRVKEHFSWAREKSANMPYSLTEIHDAVAQLAVSGLAQTTKAVDKNITAIGDFAAAKGLELGHAIQMVTKAGQGNWQSMRAMTGLTQTGLMNTAKGMFGRDFMDFDGKLKNTKTEALKAAQALQTAKVGTNEYREALIRFIGLYEKGGMANMTKTISGSFKQLGNIFEGAKIDLMGLSQEFGTFSNRIANTLGMGTKGQGGANFLRLFTEDSKYSTQRKATAEEISKFVKGETTSVQMLNGEYIKTITLKEKLGEASKGIGYILTTFWQSIDRSVAGIGDKVANLIQRMNDFMMDFKGKMAPFIVYLHLLKFKVLDFWKAFKTGFMDGIAPLRAVVSIIWNAVKWLFGGDSKTNAESIGKTIGSIVGYLVTFAALGKMATFGSMILAPFIALGNIISGNTAKLKKFQMTANADGTMSMEQVGRTKGDMFKSIAGSAGMIAGGLGAGWLGKQIAEAMGMGANGTFVTELLSSIVGAGIGHKIGEQIATRVMASTIGQSIAGAFANGLTPMLGVGGIIGIAIIALGAILAMEIKGIIDKKYADAKALSTTKHSILNRASLVGGMEDYADNRLLRTDKAYEKVIAGLEKAGFNYGIDKGGQGYFEKDGYKMKQADIYRKAANTIKAADERASGTGNTDNSTNFTIDKLTVVANDQKTLVKEITKAVKNDNSRQ